MDKLWLMKTQGVGEKYKYGFHVGDIMQLAANIGMWPTGRIYSNRLVQTMEPWKGYKMIAAI